MKIILFATCLLFVSCKKEAKSTQQTNNSKFEVEFLFEHNGVKVYRFYDGRPVYYTDCRGKTSWSETHSNGKTSHTQEYDVESIKP